MLSSSRVGRFDLGRNSRSSERASFCLRPHLHPAENEIRLVRSRQNMPHRTDLVVLSIEGASPITRSGKAPGEINKATS